MPKGNCSNCSYCDRRQSQGNVQVCRFNPPTVTPFLVPQQTLQGEKIGVMYATGFPVVTEDDWCSNWTDKAAR